MKKVRKLFVSLFALNILCVAVSVALSIAWGAESELVTIRTAIPSVKLGNAYEILGVEKGIYKKHGIDLQIIDFINGGPEAAAATISGQVDIGTVGTPVLTMLSKGVPIKIIAAPANKGLQFSLVGSNKINSVKDLRGKTVTTGPVGSGNHQSFLKILYGNGLTEKDLNIMSTGGTDPVMILSSGQVDAVQVNSDIVGRFLTDNLGHLLADAQDYYGEYQHVYIYAADAFIKEHPEALVNYIKALRETYEYARAHLAELTEKGKTLRKMEEAAIRTYYENDIGKWDLSLSINLEGARNALKVLQELGEVENNVEFNEKNWVDLRFLKEANLQ
jgi:NitT/TauT family transport system substrate-binding protein